MPNDTADYFVSRDENFMPVKNKAFVHLPSATMDGYVLPSGIIVAPAPYRRQEDAAAVIGTVVTADPLIGVKAGDRVAVNYKVTSTGTWKLDKDAYEKAVGERDKATVDILTRMRRGSIDMDKAQALLKEQPEVDQKKFSTFVHSRAYVIGQQLVWLADAHMIIAVQRDGKWHSVIRTDNEGDSTGYALIRAKKVPNPDFEGSTLEVPDHLKTVVIPGQGELVSGSECGAPEGSTVLFQAKHAAEYSFEDGDEYLIVPLSSIYGTI